MRKILALLALACGLAAPAQTTAQTTGYLTVIGSNLVDANGNPVASATITFAPVTTAGTPLPFRVGSSAGGQATVRAVAAHVTNGAFTVTLADTALTTPTNVCYAVKAVDASTGQSLLAPGYGCVQPTSAGGSGWCSTTSGTTTCNFDVYVSPQTPPVQTIVGANGLSAYQLAVLGGYSGTQSAYQTTLANLGNSGGAVLPSSGVVCASTTTVGIACTTSLLQAAIGAGVYDASGAASTAQAASLQKSANLSDLASVATARANLGLGSAATTAATAYDVSGAASAVQASSLQRASNLSDLASAATARTNLGLGSAALSNTSAFDAAGAAASAQAASDASGAATAAQAASLQKTSNLSDLSSAATARTNLGLGTAALSNTSAFDGAGAASAAQAASLQKSSNLSDLASAATARTNLGLGTAATSSASSFDVSGAATAAVTAGGVTQAAANTLSGLPTGCVQIPCQVAYYHASGVSSTTAITLYTPSANGWFRVCGGYQIQTQSSSSFSLTVLINIYGALASSSFGQGFGTGQNFSTAAVGFQTAFGYNTQCLVFSQKSSQAIQRQFANTGTNTGGTWSEAYSVEYLGAGN